MTCNIKDQQLYLISLSHYKGALLFQYQSWHTSVNDALSHGYEVQAKRYGDEPVGVVNVHAKLV